MIFQFVPYEDCCTIFTPPSPKTKPKRKDTNNLFEQYLLIDELARSKKQMKAKVIKTLLLAKHYLKSDI